MSIQTEGFGSSQYGTEPSGGVSKTGVEQAKKVSHTVRERAFEKADERVGDVGHRVSEFADRIERSFEGQGGLEQELVHRAADALLRVSRNLEGKSSAEMLAMAKRQMRERPGVVTAGLVAIGFIGGRLLRD